MRGQLPHWFECRHLLEKHRLAQDLLRVVNNLVGREGLPLCTGTAIDAMLTSALSSAKNAEGKQCRGEALDQEGQPVALRREGAYRRAKLGLVHRNAAEQAQSAHQTECDDFRVNKRQFGHAKVR